MATGSTKERQLFDLLSHMLVYKPSKRITMNEALRHPFFTDADSRRPVDELHRRRRDRSRSIL